MEYSIYYGRKADGTMTIYLDTFDGGRVERYEHDLPTSCNKCIKYTMQEKDQIEVLFVPRNMLTTLSVSVKLQTLKQQRRNIMTKFTKADLKDGMVVQWRGGCTFSSGLYGGYKLLVKGDQLVYDSGYELFESYNSDLTHQEDKCFDIAEVWDFETFDSENDQVVLKSIWKREDEEAKQEEINQIRQELKRLSELLDELENS